MTTKPRLRPRVDLDVRSAIIDLINLHEGAASPTQILAEISKREEFQGRLPLLRTVQRIVRDHTSAVSTEKWHWTDYSAEDARILLDVYGRINARRNPIPFPADYDKNVVHTYDTLPDDYYLEATDPETGEPLKVEDSGFLWLEIPNDFRWTKEFSDWVVKVYKVCPEIGDEAVFQIARHYLLATHLSISTEKLDLFLARKPWESLGDLLVYVSGFNDLQVSIFSIPGAHLRILLAVAESLYMREVREGGLHDGDSLKLIEENFAKLVGLIWVSAKWGSVKAKEDE
ncbi:MAG: hypothetical protein J4N89_02630 [Chloroflexi bacterium]|nr:hypothetical protein [Chloroflexota bacterium]